MNNHERYTQALIRAQIHIAPRHKLDTRKFGGTRQRKTKSLAMRERKFTAGGASPTFLDLRPKRRRVHHLRDSHVQQLLRRLAGRRRLSLQLCSFVANSCRCASPRTRQGERFQRSASSSSGPHPTWVPAGDKAQLKSILLK